MSLIRLDFLRQGSIRWGMNDRLQSSDGHRLTTTQIGAIGELAMHPTVKPVALVADAIFDCSKRNGIVLDAFSGSGTTIIACERTGRIG